MPKIPNGVSIIVPVYNEEEGLQQIIREFDHILQSATEQSIDLELILVNDGSDPPTRQILEKLDHPQIKVIHHKTNMGYGAGIKTGMKSAKFNYIAITDADGTYPNEKIPEFYQKAKEQKLDMLVGARKGERVHIPWLRQVPKWFISKLANYLARQSIPDINSGLRIMRKKVVEQYQSILPDGFSFTTTITLAMVVNGFSVHYENIDYHPRKGRSKIRPIQDTLNFIQLILRTTIYFDPLRVFVPLGLILWLGAVIAVILGVSVLEKIPDVTIAIFALVGFQIICLGLVADLINRKLSSKK